MAAATQTATTSRTSESKVWRIIQGELVEGLQFLCEEFEEVDDLTEEETTTWSARQVLIPINLTEDTGVASIDEFGYEAYPQSTNLDELTVDLVQFNARFNASMLAQYADKSEAQIKRQIKFQAGSKLQAMGRHFADYFHGVSTGYLSQISDTSTGTTLTHTLIGGYGLAGITTASFLADKYRVNDRVALIRSGVLVTNAIGRVGAIDTTNGLLTVTYNGSVTTVSADFVVKANSMENTTIAASDYNKGLVGLIDMTQSATVHGVANTSKANWDVAYSDTTGGRFTGSKIHRGKDEIKNKGGMEAPNLLVLDQGVYRDMINNERSSLRFTDPFNMELDGSVKAKGIKIFSSRRVPPGYATLAVKSSIKKWSLLPKPDSNFSWGDGKELIDQNGKVFRMDWPVATLIKKRRNLAYWTSLTRA